jgi:hypothetical protein
MSEPVFYIQRYYKVWPMSEPVLFIWSTWVQPHIYWGLCCSIFSFMYNVLKIFVCPFVYFSIGNCVVCPVIYGFWLPLCIFKLFILTITYYNNLLSQLAPVKSPLQKQLPIPLFTLQDPSFWHVILVQGDTGINLHLKH